MIKENFFCGECFLKSDFILCKDCITLKCRCIFKDNEQVCDICKIRNEKIIKLINELSQSIE